MTLVEDFLDQIGVNSDSVFEDDSLAEQTSETIIRDHEMPAEFGAPSFPGNPFLEDAQTDAGGLFANLGGGDLVALQEGTKLSEFPTASGSDFGLDGQFMQPVYVNITSEPIEIPVESIGFGPSDLSLDVGPYNETTFGTDPQWYRIPTGIGTPYPIVGSETAWDSNGNFEGGPIAGGPDSDYLLKEISETEDGFKVVWELIGDESTASETTTQATSDGTAEQNTEDDAETIV